MLSRTAELEGSQNDSADLREIRVQQILALWGALDLRRKLIVTVATAAMFAAILGLSTFGSSPRMALLYAGLEPAAAGDVVKALDQQGVAYQVRGPSLWVDASRRDQLRMTLAAQGLPANGNAGYELLDNLSGFGTTTQMFDAMYWRAKEGELARTIAASPDIRSARVYIAPAKSQPFQKDVAPTASVMVTMRSGSIGPDQAKALRYLVASAVAGLQPANVVIVDSLAGLIAADGGTDAGHAAADRAARLQQNVEALLQARVGPGKSVVAVNIETVTDRESIVQKTIDPNGRVAISTDTTDASNSSTDQGNAAVTVASNLPNGQANAPGNTSQSQSTNSRERTNYEVSTTQREVIRAPGTIKRLSVAVLVDGLTTTDAKGATVWEPRPATEIAALQDLVASAVGFDAKRGDVITIKSLPFQPVPVRGVGSDQPFLARLQADPMSLIQIALLALVALGIGLFVLRPVLTGARRTAASLPPPQPDAAVSPASERVLTGEIDDREEMPANLSLISSTGSPEDMPTDPVARLRRLIEQRQDETLAVLKTWVEDREERAS
ncbi:MAG: flagellar M-ring protein FliF [Paracoccaceae bacterium]|nr:flagellar M-ring protein FliF [Paracoccaceae bacterium]